MATQKQRDTARRNLEKARAVRAAQAAGKDVPQHSEGMSTAEKNQLSESEFAFPAQRKEPLTDATHVRNAVARFDQVEGVSDADRDDAWKRIQAAAKKFDVEISESSWHELFEGGKARKK